MTFKEAYKILAKDLIENEMANSDEWNEAICLALEAIRIGEEYFNGSSK